jgi:tRNA (adenine57-N1/adenine58-N1)-methyltransferase
MDFVRKQALLASVGDDESVPTSRLSKNIIKDGDLVILYERHDSLDHMYVRKGQTLQNRFGKFHHNDIIGKPFGSLINSYFNDNGYLYVLRPTPELWCDAVHTRTQIVNDLDSSIIISNLDIFPGCRIIESGTGSGCMTCSLARTVSPSGHVYTYEYNPVRADKAREEFEQLGLSCLVTVQCHDVCGKLDPASAGFPGVEPGSMDAVFLDLPEPWHAIGPAKRALKGGKGICCYSPCIEQCIRTFEALRREGFHSLRMIEVRQRPFDGRRVEIEQLDLGPSTVPAEEDGRSEPPTALPPLTEGEYRPKLPPFVPVRLPSLTANVARSIGAMRGHTAFLTFAVKSDSAGDGDDEEEESDEEEGVGTGEGSPGAGARARAGAGTGASDARDEEFQAGRERKGKGRKGRE